MKGGKNYLFDRRKERKKKRRKIHLALFHPHKRVAWQIFVTASENISRRLNAINCSSLCAERRYYLATSPRNAMSSVFIPLWISGS